ncbi:MAG: response regulator [Provencibacterium sp.]|jgi:two-component system response regulator YesN|nr:response regulator [Provencibacterium sp.]
MYAMLVADDDPIIRDGLRSLPIWKKLNIEIVAEAADGAEALRLTREKSPQIILTDVKMPHMDGIAFANRVKSQFPHCKIAFMSGYDDVRYLKSALQISAYDYIFKPVDMEELTQCCLRMITELEQEQALQTEFDDLASRFQVGTSFVRQNLIAAILLDDGMTRERIQAVLTASGLPFARQAFQVVALKAVPEPSGLHSSVPSVIEGIRETLPAYYTVSLNREAHTYALVFAGDKCLELHDLQTAVQAVISALKRQGYRKAAAGFAAQPDNTSIYQVRPAAEAAVELLKSWFYKGDRSLTFLQEPPCETLPPVPTAGEMEKILSGEKQVGIYTDSLFLQLCALRQTDPSVYLNHLHDQITAADAILQKNYTVEEEDGLSPQTVFQNLTAQICLEDMKAVFGEYLLSLCRLLGQDQTQMRQSITRACRFIQKHYREHLTIQKIADTVYLSANYFCILFREVTGMTVYNYLFTVRMEKAKELLCQSAYKLYDVSVEVGYENPSYFSRQFKKYTGLTPSEYRNRRTGGAL